VNLHAVELRTERLELTCFLLAEFLERAGELAAMLVLVGLRNGSLSSRIVFCGHVWAAGRPRSGTVNCAGIREDDALVKKLRPFFRSVTYPLPYIAIPHAFGQGSRKSAARAFAASTTRSHAQELVHVSASDMVPW
jgi:hypothetical protein